jgi:hypothetical protein
MLCWSALGTTVFKAASSVGHGMPWLNGNILLLVFAYDPIAHRLGVCAWNYKLKLD